MGTLKVFINIRKPNAYFFFVCMGYVTSIVFMGSDRVM